MDDEFLGLIPDSRYAAKLRGRCRWFAISSRSVSEPTTTYYSSTLAGLGRSFRRWSSHVPTQVGPEVPGSSADERHRLALLGAIAAEFAGSSARHWPEPMRAWASIDAEPPIELIDSTRRFLSGPSDPFAVLYNACISSANRRRLGTVFTPNSLVDHMVDLAGRSLGRAPELVIDPGAGIGAFTVAAARR